MKTSFEGKNRIYKVIVIALTIQLIEICIGTAIVALSLEQKVELLWVNTAQIFWVEFCTGNREEGSKASMGMSMGNPTKAMVQTVLWDSRSH